MQPQRVCVCTTYICCFWSSVEQKQTQSVVYLLFMSCTGVHRIYVCMRWWISIWFYEHNRLTIFFFDERELSSSLSSSSFATDDVYIRSFSDRICVVVVVFFFMCENVAKAVKCTMHKTYTYKNPVNRCSVNSKTRRGIERERGKKPLLPQSTVHITYAFM